MPKIILFPSPFQAERSIVEVDAGTTVREAVAKVRPSLRFPGALLILNDQRVEMSDEVMGDEDTLIVRAVPGDNAWNKTGEFLNSPGGAILNFLTLGIAGVAVFAGTLAMDMLTWGLYTFMKAVLPKQGGTSGSVSIHGGRNALKPYTQVPIILGKSIISPPLGSKIFTDWDGSNPAKQTLSQLFVVGLGRYAVSSIKIGDKLVADFNPAPTPAVQLLTNDTYGKIVTEAGVGIELKASTPQIQVSVPDIDAMSLDITFPSGLCSYNSSGDRDPSRTIAFTVEYKKSTTGTWTGAASISLSYSEEFTQAVTKKADISAALLTAAGRAGYTGTWDVRITRTTGDSTDSKYVDRSTWSVLRSIQNKEPISAAAKGITTRIALTIQATDQLNGAIDNFNVEAQSVVPCYDGTGSGAAEWKGATALGYPSTWKNVNMTTGGYTWNTWTGDATSNPAALYLWILRGPANPKPIPDTLIDWPAFEAWYTFCASKGLEVNAVWDQGGAMLDLLDKIAGVGRAASMMRDSKYSVIFDQPQSVPVQHFTPRNSRNFSASKAFPTPVHAIRSQFIDAASAWKQAEQIVYMAGYNSSTATEFRTQQLWGVTNNAQAYKAIFYQVAVETLRPEIYQMEVDFEHLACQRGDLVAVSHDVLLYGLQAARVVSLTVNGGSQVLTVTLDEDVTMEVGKSYGLRWRRMDGSSIVAPVNLAVGTTRTLTFTTPVVVGSVPEVDDLISFGISGSETQPMLVVSIEMQDEFSARVTLNNYDAAVYTADSGAVPAWSSGISLPAPVGYGDVPDLSVPTTAPVSDPTRAADKAYVDAQAAAAQAAAEAYALAEANLAETTANAYADGIVSTEEARAIADAVARRDEAIAATRQFAPGTSDLVAEYTIEDLADQPFTVTQDQGASGYDVVGGTFVGGTFTKTAAAGWSNARLVSRYSIGPGAVAAFFPNNGGNTGVGFQENPAKTISGLRIDNIDFAIRNSAGTIYASENGALTALGSCVNGDSLAVVYDGLNVTYKKNGVPTPTPRSVYVGPGKKYYFDSDCYENGNSWNAVLFTDGLTYFQDAWETTDGWANVGSGTVTASNGTLIVAGQNYATNSIALGDGSKKVFVRAKIVTGDTATQLRMNFGGSGTTPTTQDMGLLSNEYRIFTAVTDRQTLTEIYRDAYSSISATLTIDYIYIGQGYQSALTDTSRNGSKMFLQRAIPTIGKSGKAVDFGGVGYGQMQFPVGTEAIPFWFRVPTGSGFSVLLSGGSPGTLASHWYLSVGDSTGAFGDESLTLSAYSPAGSVQLEVHVRKGTSFYIDGEWHHVIATFSGAGKTGLIVDGARQDGYYSAGTVNSDVAYILPLTPTKLGRYTYTDVSCPVSIDELRAYKRAPTDAEALWLYANPGQVPAQAVENAKAVAIASAPKYLGKWKDTFPVAGNIGDTCTRYSETSGATNRGVFRWNGATWDRTEAQADIRQAGSDIAFIIAYKNTAGVAIYGSAADYSGDSTVQADFGFFQSMFVGYMEAHEIKVRNSLRGGDRYGGNGALLNDALSGFFLGANGSFDMGAGLSGGRSIKIGASNGIKAVDSGGNALHDIPVSAVSSSHSYAGHLCIRAQSAVLWNSNNVGGVAPFYDEVFDLNIDVTSTLVNSNAKAVRMVVDSSQRKQASSPYLMIAHIYVSSIYNNFTSGLPMSPNYIHGIVANDATAQSRTKQEMDVLLTTNAGSKYITVRVYMGRGESGGFNTMSLAISGEYV